MGAIKRIICLPIDDLLRMLGDYVGESTIPYDSKPHRLLQHPSTRRMGLEIDAPSLPEGGSILVDFQIKRFSPVSGVKSTSEVTS